MDDLEEQLRRAFAPEDPPAGFAGRVMERAGGTRRPAPRWRAAAAAVLILAGGGYGYRLHRGEMAKREVLLALRIASVKVNQIQTQVSR
jgi:hypothetical protein